MREEDEGVECSVVSGHQEDWREWVILGWGVASISIQWPLLLLLLLPSLVDINWRPPLQQLRTILLNNEFCKRMVMMMDIVIVKSLMKFHSWQQYSSTWRGRQRPKQNVQYCLTVRLFFYRRSFDSDKTSIQQEACSNCVASSEASIV